MKTLKTIEWVNNAVRIIDQTCLPDALEYEDIQTVESMVDAIKVLKIRGAPAIGIAAAFGLYLAMRDFPDSGSNADFMVLFGKNSDFLFQSRPTAVNLPWALSRIRARMSKTSAQSSIKQLKNDILDEAHKILEEDKLSCRAIGEHGFDLIKNFSVILTHCNAGGLATSEFGTALAPIYIGKERGKKFRVFTDETRPLLQGSRISAFELLAEGIDVTVICDNMAAWAMKQKKVDAVIVGADRIAANGDAANKIGTYALALVAAAHKVPFYVAAPASTFDLSLETGDAIPIEERSEAEITCGFGKRTAPLGVHAYNPAFDVTPNSLITSIITDKGVLMPPYSAAIKSVIGSNS